MSKRNRRRQKRQRRYHYSGPAKVSAPAITLDAGLAWFAVWTRSRAERKAELRLREAGFSTFLPSEAHLRQRRGVVYPIERLAVGRYLFVGLDATAPEFGAVRDIEEVQDFVSVQGFPLRVATGTLQAFANELSGRVIVLKGGAFSRLMAIMDQADDARLRERGPFWSEAA